MKILHTNVYKQEEKDHNLKWPCKFFESSPLSSHSLLVKSFEDEIQSLNDCVDMARS